MDKTVAAIEVSSKQIKLVVGYVLEEQVFVLYTLCKPISGLVANGKIIDPELLGKEIGKMVDIYDGQAKLKIKIEEVLLILPPCGLEIFQSQNMTNVVSDEIKVTNIDISNLYAIIKNGKLPVDNVLIDIVPFTFMLDNNRIFSQPPLGESSRTVKVNARVHTLPPSVSDGYFSTMRFAGLRVIHSMVAPFAASTLIDTFDETPSDYFLVDIGSNLTSVSLVGRKQLFAGRTFSFGGDYITRRIATEFAISDDDAEHLKILYGIENRELNFKAPICTSESEDGTIIKHYTDELNLLIKSELDEFIRTLKSTIDELLNGYDSKYKKMPLIFIGGGSLLNGFIKYVSPKIDNDVVYNALPKTLGARNPSLFNCLGAILVHSRYPVTVDDNQPKIGVVTRKLNDEE